MAGVDISYEALGIVRESLIAFKIDIEGLTAKANQRSEACELKCKKIVISSEDEVQSLDYEIEKLSQKLNKLQTNINDLTNSIDNIERKLPVLNNKASELSDRIASLHSIQASLKSGSNTDDGTNNDWSHIESEISRCEREKDEIIKEIQHLKIKKDESEQRLSAMKTQKMKCEDDMRSQKKRRAKYQDKLDRLKASFSSVCSDLDEYVGTVKKYEGSAKSQISADQSALSSCISAIDEYLGVGIGTGSHSSVSTSSGGSPQQITMAEYILSCASGEYQYQSAAGQATRAYGQLMLDPNYSPVRSQEDRSAQRRSGGENRCPDDHGGHIIGMRFGGTSTEQNLFPQNGNFNQAAYRQLENEWRSLLQNGCQVFVDINVTTANSGNREDSVFGTYVVIRPNGSRYEDWFGFTNESRTTQETWDGENGYSTERFDPFDTSQFY